MVGRLIRYCLRKLLHGKPGDKRSNGRPRKRREENVENDLKRFGALDRYQKDVETARVL